MKKVVLPIIAAVILAGCGENTPVQTVEWYKTHGTERMAMIKKCQDSLGELAASPNCINAIQAANEMAVDKRGYKKRTPIDLSQEGK